MPSRILLALAVLPVAWLMAVADAAAASVDRPNVLLVMTDDQGYGDLSCHGNPWLKTPNLDAFAKESIRFVNFHVDPTCSETRSALMTGRYSARVGVWHTIMGRSILREGEVTMPEVFRANGYVTGGFGKWHLGDSYPFRPEHRGFDETLMHGGGGVGQTPDYWGNDYFDDTYFRNGKPEPQQGYCTDVFFAAAQAFIEKHRDKPFFCYLATNAPHGPYLVPEAYAQPYHSAGLPGPMANFYGMIANIDENFGKLLAQLDRLDLAERTIVIFMTDNGSSVGQQRAGGKLVGHNAGMRGNKGSQFDGGHRVPCFIRWPEQIPAGRDIPQVAAHFDLLPTLIDVCGLKPPREMDLDGRSLRPLWGAGGKWPQRALVVHSQRIETPQKWRKCSVMTDRWRLVDGQALFDMQADPGQQTNVADDHPEVVQRLRGTYERWWEDVSPRFDEYVRFPLGDPRGPKTIRLTAHDWHAPIREVPWSQVHIRRGLRGNGFWAVRVAREGSYRFELRRWPQSDQAIPFTRGRVRVGEAESEAKVEGAKAVVELRLEPGEQRLQTWLVGQGDKTQGAYYVDVTRLGD